MCTPDDPVKERSSRWSAIWIAACVTLTGDLDAALAGCEGSSSSAPGHIATRHVKRPG